MLQRLKQDDVQMTQNPDGSIKAKVLSHNITVYLNKELGEKDWTGYAKNRYGIAYRLHIVRNGFKEGGKNNYALYLETLADQENMEDYTIFLIAEGLYDLPVKDSGNQTTRHQVLSFDTAENVAEYEDMLKRDYPEVEYAIETLQKGHQVPTEWTTRDESVPRTSAQQIEDQLHEIEDLLEDF